MEGSILENRHNGQAKQKRSVLEGEDDGEGHSWKVLKANGGAVDVYYGKGAVSYTHLTLPTIYSV